MDISIYTTHVPFVYFLFTNNNTPAPRPHTYRRTIGGNMGVSKVLFVAEQNKICYSIFCIINLNILVFSSQQKLI